MAEKTEKKSGNQIVKLALVLLAVAAIMALVLGVVNEITKDRIAELAAEKTATAYANVLPADNYDTEVETDDTSITKMVVAKDASGEAIGYVAETTFSGAQGMITMVVGLDNDKVCTGVYITKHSETSGLGAKAAETTPGAWRDNVVGQGDGLKVNKDGGEVEAISGATITSRSVTNEIQAVINAANALG
ncbi:MAG: RnfABCDGE type electron transport complex subunit G [Oscillospiraceae bacterium]|nr:RnfABCDGE type electron transport complex subunit G [Oscillospiraceae bacterium]